MKDKHVKKERKVRYHPRPRFLGLAITFYVGALCFNVVLGNCLYLLLKHVFLPDVPTISERRAITLSVILFLSLFAFCIFMILGSWFVQKISYDTRNGDRWY